MSAIDNLTACIVSFHREERLEACLASVRKAGIHQITICQPEGPAGPKWDVGCNNSWMIAAYRSLTKRIWLGHDDDFLKPEFGEAYETIIAPCLDKRDAGFASWRPEIRYDDGRTEPCDYWPGAGNGSMVVRSDALRSVVACRGRLSLSPVVSVLNRAILIRACKEAGETLRLNASLERPGMVLGTEILVYLRHCQHFHRWLFVDKFLSQYGAHENSGTVKHQLAGTEAKLTAGYDLARDQALAPAPEPTPRIIFVHDRDPEYEKSERVQRAQESWDWHFSNAQFIDFPYYAKDLPKIKDLLDYGARFALPEDFIVYANADTGFTALSAERIGSGVRDGKGVACLGSRNLVPDKGRIYYSVANCKTEGGIDAVACTPAWWARHRDLMPDMFIGREGWDRCFAALAEEWADGQMIESPDLETYPDKWLRSKAHCDDVAYTELHPSYWEQHRLTDDKNLHNRELARTFFAARGPLPGWLK